LSELSSALFLDCGIVGIVKCPLPGLRNCRNCQVPSSWTAELSELSSALFLDCGIVGGTGLVVRGCGGSGRWESPVEQGWGARLFLGPTVATT
jgi:hypothetical protein